MELIPLLVDKVGELHQKVSLLEEKIINLEG
jgi:hypothetical protein